MVRYIFFVAGLFTLYLGLAFDGVLSLLGFILTLMNFHNFFLLGKVDER